MVDFTNCKIDIEASYGGSDQKRGIIYNGERYMLKLPDKIDTDTRLSINSSYSNSVYSEKVSCDILSALGFNVQETLLGTFNNRPVVACKNFVPKGATLISFRTIANTILPEKLGKVPKISEIYAVLSKDSDYFTTEGRKVALESYWDLFILDALLGNFDRHGDNWGYLKMENELHFIPSPIYDCGSCLYPKLADSAIEDILSNPEEVAMRVDKFPQAALMLDNGTKVNYKNFIHSKVNKDCTMALNRVFPKIDLDRINAVINGNNSISDVRKCFYRTMIKERYERILKPAYMTKASYLITDFLHDPPTLMKVMENHSNYKEWFNTSFPNGANSREEVIAVAKGSCTDY